VYFGLLLQVFCRFLAYPENRCEFGDEILGFKDSEGDTYRLQYGGRPTFCLPVTESIEHGWSNMLTGKKLPEEHVCKFA